jgi:hypothetical protein
MIPLAAAAANEPGRALARGVGKPHVRRRNPDDASYNGKTPARRRGEDIHAACAHGVASASRGDSRAITNVGSTRVQLVEFALK